MTKKLLILALLISLLIGSFFIERARAEAPEPTYDDLLEQWVHQLAICESNQTPSLVNQYDGGSPSYGYVQFKLGTMWAYNKKFNTFPEMTIDNLHQMTMQKDVQVKMAMEIIKHDYAYKNWYNCTVGKAPNKVGLPPKME